MPSFPYNVPCLVKRNGILIKEFPTSFNRLLGIRTVMSGGGYFRFWPYNIIQHYTKKSPYVMSYFHPRDFDRTQPILPDLNPYRKFRAYYGLNSSMQKLEQWICDYSFIDLGTANKSINWETAPIVNL
jgi:hypothetical protein